MNESESALDAEFKSAFENAKVVFGLEAQGHIPTIRKMLAQRATWSEIGAAIGWDAETARTHYQWWSERMLNKLAESTTLLLPVAEKTLEISRRLLKKNRGRK